MSFFCRFWSVTVSSVFGVLDHHFWSALGVLECHGLVRFFVFSLSLSGPLLCFSTVAVLTVFGVFHCHCLVHVWGSGVSRSGRSFWFWSITSGPLLGFSLSRSGPLLRFFIVTVCSALAVFHCHGRVL